MTIPGPPYVAVSPTVPVAVTVQATSPGQVTISPAGLPGPAAGTLPGAIAPAISTLAYGTAITVNTSLGNYFRLTLTGSAGTIETPTGGLDAQQITIEIIQDDVGGRTVAWSSAYTFAAVPEPTLSTAPYAHDLTAFLNNASASSWWCVAALTGY